jgi:hypothetical protein
MADSLKHLLDGMGNTPDEIAAFLEGQGCVGDRGHTYRCPVATYVRRVTGRLAVIHTAVVRVGDSETGRTVEWTKTPNPVRDFVARFDGGQYPNLLRR